MISKIKKYIQERDDDGFSLLELVVAVGILLVLTVGGLLAYNGITKNAREAAVQSAADEVLTGAIAYDTEGKDYKEAEKEWMGSAKKDKDNNSIIKVEAVKDSTTGGICVVAEMEAHEIKANKGAGCEDTAGNPGGDNSGEVIPPGGDDNNGGVITDPDDNNNGVPGDEDENSEAFEDLSMRVYLTSDSLNRGETVNVPYTITRQGDNAVVGNGNAVGTPAIRGEMIASELVVPNGADENVVYVITFDYEIEGHWRDQISYNYVYGTDSGTGEMAWGWDTNMGDGSVYTPGSSDLVYDHAEIQLDIDFMS